MIERHHDVVQAHSQGGHTELVHGRRRQALQTASQLVAEQSGGAALERRQFRHRRSGEGFHSAGQNAQSIATVGRKLHEIERVGRQERITSQRRVTQGTVEKQTVWQTRQPHKHVFRLGRRHEFFDQRQDVGPVHAGNSSPPVIVVGVIIARTPIGIYTHDHRWRRRLLDHHRLRCLRRTGLHRGNHARGDALLLKGDQILGL